MLVNVNKQQLLVNSLGKQEMGLPRAGEYAVRASIALHQKYPPHGYKSLVQSYISHVTHNGSCLLQRVIIQLAAAANGRPLFGEHVTHQPIAGRGLASRRAGHGRPGTFLPAIL